VVFQLGLGLGLGLINPQFKITAGYETLHRNLVQDMDQWWAVVNFRIS